MKKTKTLKVRVKDKHVKLLNNMARSVNFVWNYINELSTRSIKERGKFLSAYDIHPYTKGAGKELGLHSQSEVAYEVEFCTDNGETIAAVVFKPEQLELIAPATASG